MCSLNVPIKCLEIDWKRTLGLSLLKSFSTEPVVTVVVDDTWLVVIVVEVETTGEDDAEVGLVVLVEEELAVVPTLEVEATGDDAIEVDPVVLVGEELAVVPILVVVVGEEDVDLVWTFVLDVDDRGRVVDDAVEVVRDVVVGLVVVLDEDGVDFVVVACTVVDVGTDEDDTLAEIHSYIELKR
ncbi:hypothetical protein Q1695_000343 [Nippostrongylus brasiliensis]|nr:hypothetical protein Q1695_000343 [Nippostrongylus brasiliensis]